MNYIQKQAALQKLAQVRLAINYVLRDREMQKQAAGNQLYTPSDLHYNMGSEQVYKPTWLQRIFAPGTVRDMNDTTAKTQRMQARRVTSDPKHTMDPYSQYRGKHLDWNGTPAENANWVRQLDKKDSDNFKSQWFDWFAPIR